MFFLEFVIVQKQVRNFLFFRFVLYSFRLFPFLVSFVDAIEQIEKADKAASCLKDFLIREFPPAQFFIKLFVGCFHA